MIGPWQKLQLDLEKNASEAIQLGNGDLAQLVLIQVSARHAIDATVSARIEWELDGANGVAYPLIAKIATPSSSKYITAVGTHFKVRVTDVRENDAPGVNQVHMMYSMRPLD